ncbi:helix-turn-helix transcriptional regulator [Kineosporia sp. NBRC 101731]|uniref:helix-turn-helix transcriptional regulator n=1 Tax=Kineosporia sp. NBRC 101731 TaxID=3032199 RepID=UPI0024A06FC4|nr:helix-turn-helix transcriptional regulator [Kineosporia sp. NBRC 101731]GLY29288.1 transcriptional regulator [Kineosporia sp. NBRC 101731]
MDGPNEIREFLISRRNRLTPAQAGLPDFGGRRRVVGLRREEVALLAGMSVEYYVRLERGNASGVSESILEGISRALQLDDAERDHLYDLVRYANRGARPRNRRDAGRLEQVRPVVQQILDQMRDVPALVQNGRLDVLAVNDLAAAVYAPLYEQPQRPANFGRFIFLDPRAQEFHRNWDEAAAQTVALLRAEAGRVPHDRRLTALVGELSTRSDHFRHLWAAHDVREHRASVNRFHHPVVGDLELVCEGMELTNNRGLILIAYAALDQPSQDALRLLGSWSAVTSGEAADQL